jgi:hypothetical protein
MSAKTNRPSRLLLGFKLIHQIEEIVHRGYFIVGARMVGVKLGRLSQSVVPVQKNPVITHVTVINEYCGTIHVCRYFSKISSPTHCFAARIS